MKLVEVTYTKRYHKSTTKEVEVPQETEDVEGWILENAVRLFEDEITAASLDLEDDEVYILEGQGSISSVDDEREAITNKIISIIEKHGEFSTYDVEADHAPYVETSGRLSHLMEDFRVDGGVVKIYDPSSNGLDEIDEYDANYEDLTISQLEYVLELAELWSEYNDEED